MMEGPDTGATITVVDEKVAVDMGMPRYPNPETVRSVDGTEVKTSRTCEIAISHGMKVVVVTNAVVAPLGDDEEVIVDWQTLEILGEVALNTSSTAIASTTVDMTMESLKLNYGEVFADKLDKTRFLKGEPMKIHLVDGNIQPMRISSTNGIPVHLRAAADKCIKDLEDADS